MGRPLKDGIVANCPVPSPKHAIGATRRPLCILKCNTGELDSGVILGVVLRQGRYALVIFSQYLSGMHAPRPAWIRHQFRSVIASVGEAFGF